MYNNDQQMFLYTDFKKNSVPSNIYGLHVDPQLTNHSITSVKQLKLNCWNNEWNKEIPSRLTSKFTPSMPK